MWDSRSSLPPDLKEVFTHLQQVVDEEAEGLSRSAALESLVAAGYEADAADYLIERLRLKGYLYEVNSELRLTE